MKIKKMIKLFIPPILWKIKNRILKSKPQKNEVDKIWQGNYNSWQEVAAECTGYDADNILNKCKSALLKVKAGDAVYERDSVIFDKKEYAEDLLKALLDVAKNNDFKLHVLDFGGSLGSSYYQNKDLLLHLKELSWNIIEQKNFVKEGKATFEDDILQFYFDIDSCLKEKKINVILFSGVLQYLEKPYLFIENILKHNIEYIIIDRTSFINGGKARISKQTVPESIYKASYPIHFFYEIEFLRAFEKKYTLISDFYSFCDPRKYTLDNETYGYWKGFVLKKNK